MPYSSGGSNPCVADPSPTPDPNQYLPSPEREILYWLCDCADEVAQHEASNKMSVTAIAVVPRPPPSPPSHRPRAPPQHLTPYRQPPLCHSLPLPPGACAQLAALPSRPERPDGRAAAHTDVGPVHEDTARYLSRRVTARLACCAGEPQSPPAHKPLSLSQSLSLWRCAVHGAKDDTLYPQSAQ